MLAGQAVPSSPLGQQGETDQPNEDCGMERRRIHGLTNQMLRLSHYAIMMARYFLAQRNFNILSFGLLMGPDD